MDKEGEVRGGWAVAAARRRERSGSSPCTTCSICPHWGLVPQVSDSAKNSYNGARKASAKIHASAGFRQVERSTGRPLPLRTHLAAPPRVRSNCRAPRHCFVRHSHPPAADGHRGSSTAGRPGLRRATQGPPPPPPRRAQETRQRAGRARRRASSTLTHRSRGDGRVNPGPLTGLTRVRKTPTSPLG